MSACSCPFLLEDLLQMFLGCFPMTVYMYKLWSLSCISSVTLPSYTITRKLLSVPFNILIHCKKYLVKMTTSAWLLQFQGLLNRWVA